MLALTGADIMHTCGFGFRSLDSNECSRFRLDLSDPIALSCLKAGRERAALGHVEGRALPSLGAAAWQGQPRADQERRGDVWISRDALVRSCVGRNDRWPRSAVGKGGLRMVGIAHDG